MAETMETKDDLLPTSPELERLRANKIDGYNYRERRHTEWDENYELARDKVKVNRLTQRQSVNIPLMKQTMRTLLANVDDMPVLEFENLDNDKDAEIFENEYWKFTQEQNKMEILDVIDKKQEFTFGRTFDQWQIIDGKIKMTVIDPMDILVSRYSDPVSIHSSKYLIHTHIFKTLGEIEKTPEYDQEKVKMLKTWYGTQQGLVKVATNTQMLTEKNQKMADMGVSDIESPVLGETYVELSLHFVYEKEEGDEEEQIYLYVECDDMAILMKKKLEEIIGTTADHYFRTHYPYCSWADDVERQDFWSDGIADIVRTPNKVLNSWFSQLVENRTLRNFGMNYYDSTVEGFTPQTFSPVPWGWYGVPGKPSEVFQKVDIPDLSESLDEMTFIINMVEKSTGSTSTLQGVQTENKITLGEVELALGEAKQRIKGISKFYTQAWKDRGEMFLKLIDAGSTKLDAVKIYKKGRNTSEMFGREIEPKDWMTDSGYRVRVWSQDEKNAKDQETLQKLNAVKLNMPNNPKLDEVYQRKLLEFAGLTPDEINEIMETQKQQNQMMATASMMGTGQPTTPGQTPQVVNKQLAAPGQPRPTL